MLSFSERWALTELAKMQPTKLAELEAHGFWIPCVLPEVVFRWMRRSSKWAINERTITSFGRHLLRRRMKPVALVEQETDDGSQVIALRFNEAKELEARILTYLPNGLWLPQPNDLSTMEQQHGAGWFMSIPIFDANNVPALAPRDRLKEVYDKVEHLLAQHPVRPLPQMLEERLEGLSPVLSFAFAFHLHLMLRFAVYLKRAEPNSAEGRKAQLTRSSNRESIAGQRTTFGSLDPRE